VTVNNGAPDVLKATAFVDPADAIGESDETNNKQEATTTVSGTVCTTPPCIDLVVSDVFDTPDPVANGGSTTYTVSVVNVGDTATNPTTVWDMHFFFTGTGSVTVTPLAGVTCAIFGGDPKHIHCTGVAGADAMDLAPGAGITFIVTVTGMATGTASLEVIADIFDVIPEFTNSNNSVTETTTINP
jgi:subtilase family serine protease